MSVTQVHMGSGTFNIGLRFPGAVWDDIREFGHIVIVPKGAGASLANSVYTGVVLNRVRTDRGWAIGGKGMDFWLGDGIQFGEVLEPPKLLLTNYWEGSSFTTVINTLKPSALSAGTISGTGLTAGYYNEHIWDTPLNAIKYVIDAYSAIHDTAVEYRVNQDGSFDCGLKSGIYVTSPTAVITRRKNTTAGHTAHGGGKFTESMDATNYATRAVLQAQGAGYTLKVGEADLVDIGETNAYKDIQGNTLDRVKIVNEPETPQYTNNPNYLPDFRAELHLKDSQGLGQRVSFRGAEWDLEDIGSFNVGDMIWVYNDQDSDWEDTGNPISYDGGTIYPVAKRVFKKTWPVHKGQYDVHYRSKDNVWTDLTSYVVNEANTKASVEVGDAERKLAYNPDVLRSVLLDRATHNPDTNNDPGGQVDGDGKVTVPAQVQWANTPWGYNTWADEKGEVKVEILVQWAEPNNTNTEPITDGDRYELDHRRSDATVWRPSLVIGWGETQRLVSGLESTPTSGWNWEFRIRAVDNAGNAGAWSTTENVVAADSTPPSQPSAPVITSLPLFFELSHDGSKNSGGSLETDTKFLNYHISSSSGFTPSSANLVGTQPINFGSATIFYADVSSWGEGTQLWAVVVAEDWVGNQSAKSPEDTDTVNVISETVITDGSITTPKLDANSVTAAKLTAITIEVGKDIKSTGFNPGTGGFKIEGNGNSEFNNIIARGTIYATAGEIGDLDIVSNINVGSTLTFGVGGVLRTSVSGNRIELTDTNEDRISFYSGMGSEFTPAYIQTQDFGLGSPGLRFRAGNNGLYLTMYSSYLLVHSGRIRVVTQGTSLLPEYGLSAGAGVGMYLSGSNQISFSTSSIERLRITSSGKVSIVASGTAAAPSLYFAGDGNSGFFRVTENFLGVSVQGSIAMQWGPGADKYIYGLTTGTTNAMHYNTSTKQITYVASTRKIKKNIKTFKEIGLSDKLRPVWYQMKTTKELIPDYVGDLSPGSPWRIGQIAEEVAEVIPDSGIVMDDELINYEDRAVIAILLADLQDARSRIKVLESSVKT